MTAIPADFVSDVRDALSVSASYDAKVERIIRQSLQKLLRDYNFPKTVTRLTSAAQPLGASAFTLPAAFKKPLQVQLIQPGTPPEYLQLHRADTFRLPQPTGSPYYYWMQGTQIALDTPLPQAGLLLDIFYQSSDVDAAIPWFFVDFPDVLRSYSIYRAAGDMRKSDVASLYQGYSQDDLQSIAIYLNELEWNDIEFEWRERDAPTPPRYGR